LRSNFLYRFLFIIFFLIGLSPFLHAQALDITSPIEQKFYQGSPEQIKDFVEKWELHVKQIISQLNLIPKDRLSSKDKKDLLDALDLFEGLSFQFARLKREIRSPEYTLISLPSIGTAPYKLQDLDRYLSTYRQTIQKLKEYQKQLRVISANISEMEQQLKQMFILYLDLKKDPDKKIKAHALFAQLVSLQVEYALKMLKKSRLSKAIEKLTPLTDECKDNIAEIFGNLSINDHDITLVISQQKKIDKKEESLRKKILSKQKILNKKITLFDLRLDSIINKLGSAHIQEAGKKLLRVEKERIEAYLNRFQYQKEMLNQENVYLRLSRISVDFRYDWITNYSRYAGYKETGSIIREWTKRLNGIRAEAEQLKEKLDQVRFDLSILNERMIRIVKEMETESDQQVKDSLKTLYSELRHNKDYLNKLIDQ